ncbi:hypothetical protein ACWGID_28585 [Kribbella sp. NPDC054772]
MRLVWGIAAAVVLLVGCGSEVSSGSRPSPYLSAEWDTPVPSARNGTPGPPTVPATTPIAVPHRTPAPQEAFQQLTVDRLKVADKALPVTAGQAQVIFSCDYEANSAQDSASGANRQNPPGENRGPNGGDRLAPGTLLNGGKYFTDQNDPDVYLEYYKETYTQDAWPTRHVMTIFRVPKERLTRANLVNSRNEYAKGCSNMLVWFDPRVVKVNLYAPWPVTF